MRICLTTKYFICILFLFRIHRQSVLARGSNVFLKLMGICCDKKDSIRILSLMYGLAYKANIATANKACLRLLQMRLWIKDVINILNLFRGLLEKKKVLRQGNTQCLVLMEM